MHGDGSGGPPFLGGPGWCTHTTPPPPSSSSSSTKHPEMAISGTIWDRLGPPIGLPNNSVAGQALPAISGSWNWVFPSKHLLSSCRWSIPLMLYLPAGYEICFLLSKNVLVFFLLTVTPFGNASRLVLANRTTTFGSEAPE